MLTVKDTSVHGSYPDQVAAITNTANAEAAALRNAAQKELDTVLADKDLSTEAVARQRAEISGRLELDMGDHVAEYQGTLRNFERDLMTKTHKDIPTLDKRDAYDRASSLTSEEDAMSLARRATATNDISLGREVALKARAMGWIDAVNVVVADDVGFLNTLRGMDAVMAARSTKPEDRVKHSANFSTGLKGMNP